MNDRLTMAEEHNNHLNAFLKAAENGDDTIAERAFCDLVATTTGQTTGQQLAGAKGCVTSVLGPAFKDISQFNEHHWYSVETIQLARTVVDRAVDKIADGP